MSLRHAIQVTKWKAPSIGRSCFKRTRKNRSCCNFLSPLPSTRDGTRAIRTGSQIRGCHRVRGRASIVPPFARCRRVCAVVVRLTCRDGDATRSRCKETRLPAGKLVLSIPSEMRSPAGRLSGVLLGSSSISVFKVEFSSFYVPTMFLLCQGYYEDR